MVANIIDVRRIQTDEGIRPDLIILWYAYMRSENSLVAESISLADFI